MSSEAFERRLASLRAEYRSDLQPRLVQLQRLWRELASGAAPAARLVELQRELHSIAGSAKTFGLPAVTESARAAEAFLEPFCAAKTMLGAAEQADFELLMGTLQRLAT